MCTPAFSQQTPYIKEREVDRLHQGIGLCGLLIQAAVVNAKMGSAHDNPKTESASNQGPPKKFSASAGFREYDSSFPRFAACSCTGRMCPNVKIKWLH